MDSRSQVCRCRIQLRWSSQCDGFSCSRLDPEAEVRTAATFNLAAVARCAALVPAQTNGRPSEQEVAEYQGPQVTVVERLVKRVTALTEDDSEHVRATLAMVATELASILGKDATITHLVPPVLLLLRDAASEVQLNLISSLGALNEVIGGIYYLSLCCRQFSRSGTGWKMEVSFF